MELYEKAFNFAYERHKGQYRKQTKLPYFTHVSEVASRVAHYFQGGGFDTYGISDIDTRARTARYGEFSQYDFKATPEEIISAAVLHDVIEDCNVIYEELVGLFGENVANIVEECSRDAGHETKQQKYDFLKSFGDKSPESVLVKIADRYCNVMDYARTPNKKHYASTYALQAYPLYHVYSWTYVGNVQEDLKSLREVVYKMYNINVLDYESHTLGKVEEVVL